MRNPTHEEAAIWHAKANLTDPFAYARCILDLENGRIRADDTLADAKRIIAHAPQNPVMIAAAKRAGLL